MTFPPGVLVADCTFSPDTHSVGLRGSPPSGHLLQQEPLARGPYCDGSAVCERSSLRCAGMCHVHLVHISCNMPVACTWACISEVYQRVACVGQRAAQARFRTVCTKEESPAARNAHKT